jgi:hypothetical protein
MRFINYTVDRIESKWGRWEPYFIVSYREPGCLHTVTEVTVHVPHICMYMNIIVSPNKATTHIHNNNNEVCTLLV